ncbi:MAG: hypothetical protein EFT35_07745 [Methanophagales archaeon ANME-1-THS]|nr:MAG: hypothetical protein EFT35_07745 [Methanophagales archaeon ANME-1-THS]
MKAKAEGEAEEEEGLYFMEMLFLGGGRRIPPICSYFHFLLWRCLFFENGDFLEVEKIVPQKLYIYMCGVRMDPRGPSEKATRKEGGQTSSFPLPWCGVVRYGEVG